MYRGMRNCFVVLIAFVVSPASWAQDCDSNDIDFEFDPNAGVVTEMGPLAEPAIVQITNVTKPGGSVLTWELLGQPQYMQLDKTVNPPKVVYSPLDCDHCCAEPHTCGDGAFEVQVKASLPDGRCKTKTLQWTNELCMNQCVGGSGKSKQAQRDLREAIVPIVDEYAVRGEEYRVNLRFTPALDSKIRKNRYRVEWVLRDAVGMRIEAHPNKPVADLVWSNPDGIPSGDTQVLIVAKILNDQGQLVVNPPPYLYYTVKEGLAFDVRSVTGGEPLRPKPFQQSIDATEVQAVQALYEEYAQATNLGLFLVGNIEFKTLYLELKIGTLVKGDGMLGVPSLAEGIRRAAALDIITEDKAEAMIPYVTQVETLLEGKCSDLADLPYKELFIKAPKKWSCKGCGEDELFEALSNLDTAGLALPFIHLSDKQRKIAKEVFDESPRFPLDAPHGLGSLTERAALTQPARDMDPEAVNLYLKARAAGIWGLPVKIGTVQAGDKVEGTIFECPQSQKCTDKCCEWFPDLQEWYCQEMPAGSGAFCGNNNGECVLGSNYCTEFFVN